MNIINLKKKKDMMRIDSNNSVEMRKMDMNLIRREVSSYSIGLVDESVSVSNNISQIEEIKFINYKKMKKYVGKKIVFYTLLGSLILLFEYLFFNYIVLNYKVLSNEEIVGIIYESLDKFIYNIILENKKI